MASCASCSHHRALGIADRSGGQPLRGAVAALLGLLQGGDGFCEGAAEAVAGAGPRGAAEGGFGCARGSALAESFQLAAAELAGSDLVGRNVADGADGGHDHLSSPSVEVNIDFAVCMAVTSDW